MEKFVVIHIVPSLCNDLRVFANYDSQKDGTQRSTLTRMIANKTDYGYSLIYGSHDILKLDPRTLVRLWVDRFTKHFHDEKLTFMLAVHYKHKSDPLVNYSTDDMVEAILDINWLFAKFREQNPNAFNYVESKSVHSIYVEYMDRHYTNTPQVAEPEPDIRTILKSNKSKRKKKKYKFKSIADIKRSKAMKMVKKNNILISDSKKLIKKDKKTIDAILKDILPDSMKKYRKKVRNRWINSLIISRKDFNKIKGKHNQCKQMQHDRMQNLIHSPKIIQEV